jgi:hypothetical protein
MQKKKSVAAGIITATVAILNIEMYYVVLPAMD